MIYLDYPNKGDKYLETMYTEGRFVESRTLTFCHADQQGNLRFSMDSEPNCQVLILIEYWIHQREIAEHNSRIFINKI